MSPAAFASASFSVWAQLYGKHYTTLEELQLRRSVFAANVAKIEKHNLEAAAGLHSWKQGVNQFTDLTADEFKASRIGGIKGANKPRTHVDESLRHNTVLPVAIDWSALGAVTPVKDQGACGACWAFSATGSTEGAVFIKKGTLISLSEQQLMDCSDSQGNQSCNGGLMDDAFQYIIDNKGLGSEASYPFEEKDDTCRTVPSVVTITAFTDVPAGSDTALMTAIAQQPVSVAIEADQSVFQTYVSGVMTDACGSQLDHGVLVVGYGTDAGVDYYKVKNSWSASWGELGYIRIGRGPAFAPNGQCGILAMASFPTA